MKRFKIPQVGIGIHGDWLVRVIRGGRVAEEYRLQNSTVTAGLNAVRGGAFNSTGTTFEYIALGSGTTTTTSGMTALVSEHTDGGLNRAVDPTGPDLTTNAVAVVAVTFTATATRTVAEMGLFNTGPTGGTMLCRVATGDAAWTNAITLNATDQLAVTATITFSSTGTSMNH